MPRYYVHVRGPRRYVTDHAGFELEDIQAAREIALQTVRDIDGDRQGSGYEAGWAVEIADEDGRVLLTVPFGDATPEPRP